MKYTVLHIPTGSFISDIDNVYTYNSRYAASFSTSKDAKQKILFLLSWSNCIWVSSCSWWDSSEITERIEISGINEFEVVEMA